MKQSSSLLLTATPTSTPRWRRCVYVCVCVSVLSVREDAAILAVENVVSLEDRKSANIPEQPWHHHICGSVSLLNPDINNINQHYLSILCRILWLYTRSSSLIATRGWRWVTKCVSVWRHHAVSLQSALGSTSLLSFVSRQRALPWAVPLWHMPLPGQPKCWRPPPCRLWPHLYNHHPGTEGGLGKNIRLLNLLKRVCVWSHFCCCKTVVLWIRPSFSNPIKPLLFLFLTFPDPLS